MSRDDVSARLRLLDGAPVEPRHELQRELFQRLADELARPRLGDRLALPQVRAGARRAALVATTLVAATAVATGLWLAVASLRQPVGPVIDDPPVTIAPEPSPSVPAEPTALSVLLDARLRWLTTPRPVHVVATVERYENLGSVTTRYEYWVQTADAWRSHSSTIYGTGTSTFTHVWDGQRELSLGEYEGAAPSAELTTYQQSGTHPWGTPLTDWSGNTYAWGRRCAEGEILEDTLLLGRRVHHLRCGQEQLWLDTGTGLLLRHERPANVDDYDPAAQTFTVLSLEYAPSFPDGWFDTTPPSGLETMEFVESRPLISNGDPAPPFVARTADGMPVRLEDFRGRPVLIVFWSPGLYDLGVVEQIVRDDPTRLAVLVYDSDVTLATEHAAYVAARGYTVPLVFDAEPFDPAGGVPIATAWRNLGVEPPGEFTVAQFWALIGPDGRTLETRTGTMLPEELDAWLVANGVE